MRKLVMGTLAALAAGAAGAGGALAQSPNRAAAGVQQAQHLVQPIPANLPPGVQPGELPAAPVDPNAIMPNGLPPGGYPTYPNGGPYGETPYDSPSLKGSGGLFAGMGRSPGNPTIWFDGSYLLLFPKSQPSGYPLVTTSAPADAGVIGRPSTTVLHGGNEFSLGDASGFRLSGGFFRPSDQRIGAELVGTYMAPTSSIFFGSSSSVSNGVPVIARPYNDTGTGGSSLVASFPTFDYGSVLSRATTKFWGLEANGLINLYRTADGDTRHWVLNFLGGFRFNALNEEIDVTSRGTLLPGSTASYNGVVIGSPTSIEVRDTFQVRNSFYGGQVGMQSQFSSGRWYVGLTGKVGAGIIHQEADITGTSNALNAQDRTGSFSSGGLFANASNIGHYNRDQFGIATDINGTVGYQITPWLMGTIGYNFMHLSSVLRPGNLYNGNVNGAVIPASAQYGGVSTGSAAVNLRQEDFYVHGLNFGFILRY